MHAWIPQGLGAWRAPRGWAIALAVAIATCRTGLALAAPVGWDDDDDGAARVDHTCEAEVEAHDHGDDDDDGDGDGDGDRAVARSLASPELGRVIAVATRVAGLDGGAGPSWARRARLAGLIPWVSVRAGRRARWADDVTATTDHGTTMEVRASWQLDRLVFDGHELQIAALDAARHRERRRLASQVIQVYFVWHRATVRARAGASAAEAAAVLDALTDGWFSNELARVRRTASEPRTF